MFNLDAFCAIVGLVPSLSCGGPFGGYMVNRGMTSDSIIAPDVRVTVKHGDPALSEDTVQVLFRGCHVTERSRQLELFNDGVFGCTAALRKIGLMTEAKTVNQYVKFQERAKWIYGILRPYCEHTEVYLGKGADIKVHLTSNGAAALFLKDEPFLINEDSFEELSSILKDVFDSYVTRRATLLHAAQQRARAANTSS